MPDQVDIISFDIEGKFAHFRKFSGNNTALSYSIPPRTTIIGILAAMVGEEKDSYYEKYNNENLKVGIRTLCDLKKSFHRLNFLKVTSREDFSGKNGRVQTPFEVVSGYDLRSDNVVYRIYLASGSDPSLFNEVRACLETNNRKYALNLGTANFSAFVSRVNFISGAQKKEANDDWLEIHSACNSDQVSEIKFPDNAAFKFNHIEEELMPADFVANNDREVYRMNRVLFTTTQFPINAKLTGTYYEIPKDDDTSIIENIQFLEYVNILT